MEDRTQEVSYSLSSPVLSHWCWGGQTHAEAPPKRGTLAQACWLVAFPGWSCRWVHPAVMISSFFCFWIWKIFLLSFTEVLFQLTQIISLMFDFVLCSGKGQGGRFVWWSGGGAGTRLGAVWAWPRAAVYQPEDETWFWGALGSSASRWTHTCTAGVSNKKKKHDKGRKGITYSLCLSIKIFHPAGLFPPTSV